MQHYLFIAGVDYEFKGVDFRQFCDNRMKRIRATLKAGNDTTFQIFDVRRGEVVTHEVSFVKGRPQTSSSKTQPYKAITRTSYDSHHSFKNGQSDIMSIVDIYRAVQELGVKAAGSLVELSFFSHGWMGGPILVNSFDDGQVNLVVAGTTIPFTLPSAARDPDDKDPRADKDFIAPTMDAVALGNFKKAFKSNGQIWIWGCAFPRLVHEILHKLEHHRQYKASGIGDDVLFEFSNFQPAHVTLLQDWLSGVAGPFPNPRKVALKFKHLKHFFCLVSQSSYTYHIASNAGVKAYGALMGTYADYDRGRLPLMSVHQGFAPHLRFYKNYLGFELDPEGRRYGVYLPGLTCPAPGP